jgi:cytochrome P450
MSNIPSHIPPEQVRPYRLLSGMTVTGDAFTEVVAPYHDGPPAFYAPDIYFGSGGWIFRRAKDLDRIYKDVECFSSHGFTNIGGFIGENWGMIPADLDPPEHPQFRMLLAPLFTPKRLTDLADRLRTSARECLARMKPGDDFIHEFADPYPVSVFLDLLGLPQSQMRGFIQWMADIMHGTVHEARIQAVRDLKSYFVDSFEQRRREPRDDMLTYVVQAKVGGRELTQDEMIGIAFNLYLGGLDTVSAMLGLHVRYLAENPEQQARLRAEPSLIPTAAEELLRAFSPATTFRVCVKAAEVAGVKVQPGDRVALPTPLAARDPEAFERPNTVDFGRAAGNVTFATGPHRCLGVHLARREIVTGLTEILALPDRTRCRRPHEVVLRDRSAIPSADLGRLSAIEDPSTYLREGRPFPR